MACAQELLRIARTLKKQPYFMAWDITVLQAFIRDEGRCVYCGKRLLDTYGVPAARDHLLPKKNKKYEHLIKDVNNSVAACAECNHLKHFYDVCRDRDVPDIADSAIRKALIDEIAKELKKREFRNDWKAKFEEAKPHFLRTVAEYKDCVRKLAGN